MGDYVYVSRRDRMIKRRGYRVELGEIEAALYRHDSITEAAVVALPDAADDVCVTAFINWNGSGPPSIIALKRFCIENLPAYMIPDRFSVQAIVAEDIHRENRLSAPHGVGVVDFTYSDDQRMLREQISHFAATELNKAEC